MLRFSQAAWHYALKPVIALLYFHLPKHFQSFSRYTNIYPLSVTESLFDLTSSWSYFATVSQYSPLKGSLTFDYSDFIQL